MSVDNIKISSKNHFQSNVVISRQLKRSEIEICKMAAKNWHKLNF